MNKITKEETAKNNLVAFDEGVVRLNINGRGELVFNPGDMNLYQRFYALIEDLPSIQKKYYPRGKVKTNGKSAEAIGAFLKSARAVDLEIKRRLGEVFGPENDFDELLGGINLMSFGSNGERVITNLINALLPYFDSGIKNYVDAEVSKANLNREQRRALQKK